MASTPSPQLPLYRITLFYGPESRSDRPSVFHCVFNVKKRSWKGGVQVSVEMEEEQLRDARSTADLDGRLDALLALLPADGRQAAGERIPDLLAQALCAVKLDLAIEAGIPQENVTIGSHDFAPELARVLPSQRDRVLDYVRAELDVPAED